jgi:hypothetical protein
VNAIRGAVSRPQHEGHRTYVGRPQEQTRDPWPEVSMIDLAILRVLSIASILFACVLVLFAMKTRAPAPLARIPVHRSGGIVCGEVRSRAAAPRSCAGTAQQVATHPGERRILRSMRTFGAQFNRGERDFWVPQFEMKNVKRRWRIALD